MRKSATWLLLLLLSLPVTLLADTLRDFTARTTLIAMLYQSTHDAAHSCAEHGRIVEQGSHHELLTRKGHYFNLYNAQFAGAATELG